jgi:hypothetical protein
MAGGSPLLEVTRGTMSDPLDTPNYIEESQIDTATRKSHEEMDSKSVQAHAADAFRDVVMPSKEQWATMTKDEKYAFNREYYRALSLIYTNPWHRMKDGE